MHEFILPPQKLSPFVKRIYEIDIPHPSTFEDNRIIPFGTGTITIVLKGNPRVEDANGVHHFPDYALSGQYFPTFSFDSDIPLLYYGIALKPTATHKLFDIYLADIQNDFLPLDEVIEDEADQIRQEILKTESTENRLRLLTDFMLNKVPDSIKYTHLDVVIDYIYEKKGKLKVLDLCEYEDVSRRYLEKKFNKFIGFTPGQFIRQVRFNFTCAEIAEGNSTVNDILSKFGYYDRSHFMKKFKRYHSDDLSVLTNEDGNLFKTVFSRIMRSESENNFHP
ncbi:Helix-turn-helix domain-containing protein [Fodinibius salinus]|uniref:Helix-turn-helix domain-containing protein n=1 Tax=Fodinibius salinus TaxID=860790 RepID=A0A5D3YFS2_9BACT|nr:response regulator transcription factor [Fodinibius salinus]TYP91748.1 Helix-turn-helix domain-containing protein [Fodinibius salinus]